MISTGAANSTLPLPAETPSSDLSAAAARKYTEAIRLDARNPFLYSNRAASYVKLGKLAAALDDALKCARYFSFH
jgi:tetratricopeptide (TPR) repeat protein